MNNPNKRYNNRAEPYQQQQQRGVPPNYSNTVASAHYNSGSGQVHHRTHNPGRNTGYPNNNNYVVTHRVEQQYSVQVMNQEQPQPQQQNRHIGSNIVPVPPMSRLPRPPSPPIISGNSVQLDTRAASAVPLSVATMSTNYNTPVSSTTTSPPLTGDDEDDYSIPELEMGGLHYKKLGEMFGQIYLKSNKRVEDLLFSKKEISKLRASKRELEVQVNNLQHEKEALMRDYEAKLEQQRRETELAEQNYATWRNNSIKLNTDMEEINVKLAKKDQEISSQKNDIQSLTTEKERQAHSIKQLKQSEQRLKKEVNSLQDMVGQKKRDLESMSDNLEAYKTNCQEKINECKRLGEVNTELKKDYEAKLQKERKQIQDLEKNVQQSKNKCQGLEETAEKCKGLVKKLETSKQQLEQKVKNMQESVAEKNEEIASIIEEKQSLKIQKEALDNMLKEQDQKITQLKIQVETLTSKTVSLSSDLQYEKQLTQRILEEQLELYTRPSLLHRLMQEKLQARTPLGLPALPMPNSGSVEDCTYFVPLAPLHRQLIEVSESFIDESTGGSETRKRKFPATSTTTDETNAKTIRSAEIDDSQSQIPTESQSPERSNKPGTGQGKESKPSHSQSSNERKPQNPSAQNSKCTNKSESTDRTIQIKFPNKPNLNLKNLQAKK